MVFIIQRALLPNNMPLTPFEAGKTAEELGIDLTRKFVMVRSKDFAFKEGTVLHCINHSGDTRGSNYWFTDGMCARVLDWSELAYASEQEQTTEGYEPKEGDHISLELEVVHISDEGFITLRASDGDENLFRYGVVRKAKLLSRKSPRKVSLREIKEHFGQDIIIED